MTEQHQAIASVAAASPAQPPKREKKQRISKRLSEGIMLLVRGECTTYKAAADRIGMCYTHFCEQLRKPHVRVFYERLVRESIAAGTMRAAARLNSLVDASSEHVSFDAAKHVLGIAGIKPAADAQLTVNIEQKAGYVIVLDGRRAGEHSQPDNSAPEISTTYEADSVDET